MFCHFRAFEYCRMETFDSHLRIRISRLARLQFLTISKHREQEIKVYRPSLYISRSEMVGSNFAASCVVILLSKCTDESIASVCSTWPPGPLSCRYPNLTCSILQFTARACVCVSVCVCVCVCLCTRPISWSVRLSKNKRNRHAPETSTPTFTSPKKLVSNGHERKKNTSSTRFLSRFYFRPILSATKWKRVDRSRDSLMGRIDWKLALLPFAVNDETKRKWLSMPSLFVVCCFCRWGAGGFSFNSFEHVQHARGGFSQHLRSILIGICAKKNDHSDRKTRSYGSRIRCGFQEKKYENWSDLADVN